MNRSQRMYIAQQTVRDLEQGGYSFGSRWLDFSAALSSSVANTRCLLSPEQLSPASLTRSYATTYSIANETTLVAASRMSVSRQHKVLALNFASGVNPGGGFLRGSEAQEESLARASGLYATLTRCPEYYEANRKLKSDLYTDAMIYSPNVPVFRNDFGEYLHDFYTVSMLTVPAVKAVNIYRKSPELSPKILPAMTQRMDKMLGLAAKLEYRVLLLGAWGCGVFRNDPVEVAKLFQTLLQNKYAGCFEQVHFAVLDRTEEKLIYQPFANAVKALNENKEENGQENQASQQVS